MADKALTDMTDEQLEDLAADLAEQRTAVRVQQVAVRDEQDIRKALAGLTPEQREKVRGDA